MKIQKKNQFHATELKKKPGKLTRASLSSDNQFEFKYLIQFSYHFMEKAQKQFVLILWHKTRFLWIFR